MVWFRRKLMRIVSLISVMVISLNIVASADTQNGQSGASTESNVGTSFYDVSTALTAFASNVVGANVNDKHVDTNGGTGGPSLSPEHKLKELENTNAGNGGAIVGYGDKEKGFVGYIAANETRSVTTSSYGAYLNIGDNGKAYTYARYGRLLNELGLDATGNASSSTSARWAGKVIQGGYLVAAFIPKSFGLGLTILKTLNPFRFLVNQDAVTVQQGEGKNFLDKYNNKTLTGSDLDNPVNLHDTDITADTIDGVDAFDTSATGGIVEQSLGRLSKLTTKVYLIIRNLGIFAILPLLLALLLFGIFSKWKGGPAQGTFSKILVYLEKMVFIFMGIPILGMCYTSVLDSVSEMVEKQPPSARIVAATFVDFENWVKTSRLEPPAGVKLVSENIDDNQASPQGRADADTWRTVRDTIYKINYDTNLYSLPSDSGLGIGFAHTNNNNLLSNDPNYFNTNAGMWGEYTDENGETQYGFLKFGADATEQTNIFNKLNSLLNVFSNAEFYTASAWESNVNSAIFANYEGDMGSTQATSNATDSSQKQSVYQMYFDTDEVNDWMNRNIPENKAIFDGTAPPAAGDASSDSNGVEWAVKPWNIFTNGSTLGVNGFTQGTDTKIEYKNTVVNPGNAINPSANGSSPSPPNRVGLSTISMYNYLSSAFNESNIAVYSAFNTTSEYTRQQHYSANVAGSGVTSTAFLLNAAVCLLIFCLIGIFYCFGLMFRNLKTGFKMIMSIPGAMVGVLKSISQTVVYVVSMIVELLGTIFLYQIVLELIMVFASIVEGPVLDTIADIGTGGATPAPPAALVGGLFSFSGSGSLASGIANNHGLFMVALFVCVAIAVLIGFFAIKLRRPIMMAWAYASLKFLRFVTYKEFLPMFDSAAAQLGSLDIWEDLKNKLKGTAKDAMSRVPNKQGEIVGRGVAL